MQENGRVSIVRLTFRIDHLPAYLHKGLEDDPTTAEVEEMGRALASRDFPQQMSREFVRSVCKWGNYSGIAGNVLKNNDLQTIANSLRQAHRKSLKGDLKGALKILIALNGLAVSFGSKHLKFLDPARNVVLDSIISQRLGYPPTPDGYCEFATDCQALLQAIQQAGVLRNDGGPFRICDVEMAIFQILRST